MQSDTVASIEFAWATPSSFDNLDDLFAAYPELSPDLSVLVGDLNENPLNVTFTSIA